MRQNYKMKVATPVIIYYKNDGGAKKAEEEADLQVALANTAQLLPALLERIIRSFL